MPKPYSQDLRERVVRAVEAGASCHEAAAAFEVSPSSAIRWVARWRQTGSAAAKPMGGKRSPLDAIRCPLHPEKQTFDSTNDKSALGHNRTHAPQQTELSGRNVGH
jgi:transposase